MRWLTGFTLADGEEKVAGHSGQLLVGAGRRRRGDGLAVHDPGPPRGTGRRGGRDRVRPPGALAAPARPGRGAARRRGGRGGVARALAAPRGGRAGRRARPGRRLGGGGARRQDARRDRADRGRLRRGGPGPRGAAAGDPCRGSRSTTSPCASSGSCGPAARRRSRSTSRASAARRPRCPHGAPAIDRCVAGEVLLFDFGAQVEGYRSDMTRTLFVGEPRQRDLDVYELVRRSQQAPIDALVARVAAGGLPRRARAGRDRSRRDRRERLVAGVRARPGPRDRPRDPRGAAPVADRARGPAARAPRCSAWSRASTSRARPASAIEDLVHLDASRGLVERLTRFPRDVIVLAG